MDNLTSSDIAQFVLIGIGAVLVIGTLMTCLIKARPRYRTFDLTATPAQPVVDSAPRHQPMPVYHPVPVQPKIAPYFRVEQVVQSVRAGDLKKTAKMTFNRALRSSQRLLSAVRREVLPDESASPDKNLGQA